MSYVPPIFPGDIPDGTDMPTWVDNIDDVIAFTINALQLELRAVMQTLGINPQGTRATVKDRLDILEPFPPACRIYHDAAQEITSGTWTTLTFNSERFDTDDMHSVLANTNRIYAQRDGIYLAYFHGAFAANAVGLRAVTIRHNSSTSIASLSTTAHGTTTSRLSAATVYQMSAGDWFDFIVYQNSGGALNLNVYANFSIEAGAVRLA